MLVLIFLIVVVVFNDSFLKPAACVSVQYQSISLDSEGFYGPGKLDGSGNAFCLISASWMF